MMSQSKTTFMNIIRYLAVYAIWMVFTVSQLGLAIWVHQLLISAAMIYAQTVKNYWIPRAVDMWSMVILGVIVLITVFMTEAYFSKGLRYHRIWQRVGMVTLIEGIVAAVLFGFEIFL